MKTLKKGDFVCLRGTHPETKHQKMKVLDVSSSTNKVMCVWINESGQPETGLFNSTSLRKYIKQEVPII